MLSSNAKDTKYDFQFLWGGFDCYVQAGFLRIPHTLSYSSVTQNLLPGSTCFHKLQHWQVYELYMTLLEVLVHTPFLQVFQPHFSVDVTYSNPGHYFYISSRTQNFFSSIRVINEHGGDDQFQHV